MRLLDLKKIFQVHVFHVKARSALLPHKIIPLSDLAVPVSIKGENRFSNRVRLIGGDVSGGEPGSEVFPDREPP